MKLQQIYEKYLNKLNEGIADSNKFDNDLQILRLAMQAELDAVNLYEQLSKKAKDKDVKDLMLDIAYEEKVHAEEFEEMLEIMDEEWEEAGEEAEQELISKGFIDDDDEDEEDVW